MADGAIVRNLLYDTFLVIRYVKRHLTIMMNIDGKHEWRDCIEVPVVCPRGYYLDTSYLTGDLSDNHDVISLKLFELTVERTPEKERLHRDVFLPLVDNMILPEAMFPEILGIAGALQQYVLLVPSVLQEDSLDKVCAQLFNLTETVVLTVSIYYAENQTEILEEHVTEENFFKCINFKVPKAKADPLASIAFSAKGATLNMQERRSVAIWPNENLVIVQTDKQIYKPGDFIRFRIVSLNDHLKPAEQMYPLISLEDPHGNRIKQWDNEEPYRGLVQLSFQLTSEPIFGWYYITVETLSGEKTYQSFSVEEYVLPKFQMSVDAPENVLVVDPEFKVNVCAIYTYGKPVEGKVHLSVCRQSPYVFHSCRFPLSALCTNTTTWLGKDGCVSYSVNTSTFELYRKGYRNGLEVHALVTEHGTGVQLTNHKYINIDSTMVRIQFENMDKDYKQGIPYVGQIKLLHPDNTPIPNEIIQLHLENKIVGNYTTDINGVAHFSLDTSQIQSPNITLQVNLNFFKEESLPGSNISLQLSAAPNSLCALRAVDKSSLLLRNYNQLSAQTVYSKLYYKQLYGYYSRGLNLEDSPKEPCLKQDQVLYNGIYYAPEWTDFGKDAYDLVKAMGLKVFTNSHYRKPVLCKNSRHPNYEGDNELTFPHTTEKSFDENSAAYSSPFYMDTVRKSFPETWIWNLIMTDSTGKASLPLTVPDTITQWKANGFCLDEEAGFGISPTISLTAFQPFFLEITLPYSVIRGEEFIIKANVFNYLDKCTQINAVLKGSSAYQARFLPSEGENVCICGNEKKSYTWIVTPQTLGTVNITVVAETPQNNVCGNGLPRALNTGWRDTVIKPLLVEPEGIEKEMVQGSLICTNGSTVSQSMVLPSPENLVEDSARASWSVLGDILGSAMHNLHSLLQMPFGCGEQNMARFAPNIYILDYLSQTQQLTEETKSKAIGYLTKGYQKQLSYKHSDGSYSTFGAADQQGNSWLTAFVYKSLAQASHYIFIDDTVQSQTLIWLINHQNSDGCFLNFGNAFNNALEGEENDTISLTAYIINALIEAGHPISSVAIQKGLQCIETSIRERATTTYDQALLAYTLSLVGHGAKREFFINNLNKKAKKVGGSVYWELEKRPSMSGTSSFYHRASSADIEMTAYVLLAILSNPQLTSEELSYASQIVQWMAKQQNSLGGFSSTKDTVVALQALTLFQKLTFSKNRQNSVMIYSDPAFYMGFHVNDRNRLLLQQIPLPTSNKNYMVEVNGNGCVYVQATLKYNILLTKKSSGFFLSVNTANAVCKGPLNKKFDLVVTASYHGRQNSSNMAIIDVKMLSGFVPDKSSIDKLQSDGKVQRVENKASHVIFYLENVSRKEIQFSFSVEQDALVSNIKPASIQLYDYYETVNWSISLLDDP
ncbi:ovostatin-like [Rhynchocyon petersi]